jgi:hypothetical protein
LSFAVLLVGGRTSLSILRDTEPHGSSLGNVTKWNQVSNDFQIVVDAYETSSFSYYVGFETQAQIHAASRHRDLPEFQEMHRRKFRHRGLNECLKFRRGGPRSEKKSSRGMFRDQVLERINTPFISRRYKRYTSKHDRVRRFVVMFQRIANIYVHGEVIEANYFENFRSGSERLEQAEVIDLSKILEAALSLPWTLSARRSIPYILRPKEPHIRFEFDLAFLVIAFFNVQLPLRNGRKKFRDHCPFPENAKSIRSVSCFIDRASRSLRRGSCITSP